MRIGCAFVVVVMTISVFGGTHGFAQSLDDFSEPLLALYREINHGMLHSEVDKLLIKHSSEKDNWSIHERDLRDRSDLWSVSLEQFVENILTQNERVSYVLHIYFVGTRVGCVLYRYWGERLREAKQKGDLCSRFGGKI